MRHQDNNREVSSRLRVYEDEMGLMPATELDSNRLASGKFINADKIGKRLSTKGFSPSPNNDPKVPTSS